MCHRRHSCSRIQADIDWEPEETDPKNESDAQREEEVNSDAEYAKMELP